MPGLFADKIIDEIREKCNIAEIIAQYIPLKRAGRNYRACCPFHKEKTPSFTVSPEKGIFHCFGCGAGGNVFNFIMKHEGLEFPQVVRILAEKTNVGLPAKSMFTRASKEARSLFEINELACDWYQSNLKQPSARTAVEYLKNRGYQAKTVLNFKLGFASSDNRLLNFMREKGVSLSLLEEAGLFARRDNGTYYERFRQRIIFPIFDVRSRVLGFGGRVLDNSMPKYMNSPQTPIYNKGNHLYGLNVAKEAIKTEDYCIIVEGYIDLLTVHQYGVGNVVASLGTALTLQQIRLLKRYTNKVIVIFDADQAGKMASLRSLDLLIEEDVQVKIVALPEGEDPDSFLRKEGRDKFRELVLKAHDLFDYKLNLLSEDYDLGTTEGKVGVAEHMLPTIRRVQNAIRRSAYIKRLAQEFSRGERSLGEEWILAELKKVKKDFQNYTKETIVRAKVIVARPAEEMVLKIALDEQDTVKEIKKHLCLEDFQDLRIREAMRLVFNLTDSGQDLAPDKLISHFEMDESAQLISRICSSTKEFIDRDKSLSDCIERIKMDNLKIRLNKLQREIKLAQSWGHKDKIIGLLSQYNGLIKNQGAKR